MKQFITIKLIGLDESEYTKFESLLTIAENMLDIPWKITEMPEADFYLLTGGLKPKMNEDASLKALPPNRCIFYAEEKTDGPYHEILVDRNNTPYLRSIIELFKTLSTDDGVTSEQIYQPAVGTVEVEVKAKGNETVNVNSFDPELGWLGQLQAQKEGFQEYELVNVGVVNKLYVDANKQLYYSRENLERMDVFFLREQEPKQLSLPEQQFQSIINDQNLKALPLSNILWYGAFVSSKGRMMNGHNSGDIVRLKRWPDISLPGSRNLIKLAAFMQSNAVDLATIHQQTGIAADQINDFVNACNVIGLIEYCQEPEVHEKKLDDKQRQLFARIGKRLKQAENSL